MVIVLEFDGPAGLVLDALAHLQLAARAWGGSIRVRDPEPMLIELLDVCGLTGTLGGERPREVERREQLGVEKRMDGDDLSC